MSARVNQAITHALNPNSNLSPTEQAIPRRRLRAVWLFMGLALLVFTWYGSLVPLHLVRTSVADAWRRFMAAPLDIRGGSKIDWGINVLLLAPAGFCLLGAALPVNSTWATRLVRTLLVAAACLLVSASIEFSQSWFPPRVPSRADVVAQFLGAAAGLAMWWLCGRAFNRALADFLADKRADSWLDLCLLAYILGLVLYSLAPLDLTLHPDELYNKFRRGQIALVPFSAYRGPASQILYDVVTDILLYIPVGVFSATFPTRRNGEIRTWPRSLVVGGAIVVGIELGQLFVLSRYCDASDVLTGMLGVASGVYGFRRYSRRPTEAAPTAAASARLLFAAAVYSFVVVGVLWAPYNFTTSNTALIGDRLSNFVSVPFARALAGDYFSALNGFLQKLLLFGPLGAWVPAFTSTLRPASRTAANLVLLGLIAGLALAVELGQILLPGRFASFDDVLICFAGALAGFWLMQRIRRHRLAAEPV